MQKRIAVLPFNRGLAHILRSLTVAAVWQRAGHEVQVWLPKEQQAYAAEAGVRSVDTMSLMSSNTTGAFEEHLNPQFIYDRAADIRRELADFNPDVVLADFHLPGLVAARSLGLDIIYISHTTGLPGGFSLPAIGVPEPVFKPVRPLLEAAAKKAANKYIRVLDEVLTQRFTADGGVFDGVRFVIPEPEGYLQARDRSLQINWCGPLLWPAFEQADLPPDLPDFPKDKTVYLTGGGTGFDTHFAVKLAAALLDGGHSVIVTGGGRLDINAFPRSPQLYAAEYLPGTKAMSRSGAVICHGGYGTLVQAAAAGTPALCMPVNADQLVHSVRMQQLGVARTLWPLRPGRLRSAIANDLAGLEAQAHKLTPAQVLRQLGRLPKSTHPGLEFDYESAPAKAASVLDKL